MCYFNGQRVTREEFIRLMALEREVKKYDFLNVGLVDGFTQTPLAVLVPNQNRTNFDNSNVRIILWNVGLIILSFFAPSTLDLM